MFKSHRQEIWLVLLLSLGASAIYSTLSLLRKLASPEGLAGSTTTINRPVVETPWLDLIYQLVGIGLALVPVLLALYFLRQDQVSIGLIPNLRDVGLGVLMAASIGIPGIGLYFLALELGLTSRVVPSSIGDFVWTIPILLLAALRSGLQEEVIVVGFLLSKLKLVNPTFSVFLLVLTSAAIRASYHSYQGFSAVLGNFVMGIVFALVFLRTARVAPLVIAHTLMNSVVFIGYPLLG
ncbi:CPBP family intramembrane glutamic endopeptidase [Aquiluna sp. KACHI24]|uniref:CPBP family intramembrane glutamic endopeptidase n=1 Tax=Aquiluna sp. KACHI24 TaxID=2968831 RepID=UPI00220897D3|nr:CPBP family intramembrane glutamic endopeptidase [Aquiluna sp. KACHI24]BDQ00879.1 CAAX amino protease [Aquiluna sp. KACHI24]